MTNSDNASAGGDEFASRSTSALVLWLFLWGIAATVAAVSGGGSTYSYWFIAATFVGLALPAFIVARVQRLHRRGVVPMASVGVVGLIVAVVVLAM